MEPSILDGTPDQTVSFLHEPIGRLLWKNAAPAVGAMLVMALYQIVDGAMVGRRLGPDALAAVNILYPVVALFVGLAVMLGVGGNVRIAVLLGCGRTEQARRVLSLLVGLGLLVGVTGSLFVLQFAEPLTSALGAADSVKGLSLTYLVALCPFFSGFVLSFILEQSVRNDGKAGLAGTIMAGSAVLNVGLDYLFLFRWNLGIAGAALASGISMSLGATIYLVYFIAGSVVRRSGLRLARPVFDLYTIAAIAANGSSELFSALAVGLVTLLFNRALMHHLGSIGVAAFAMVQYLLLFGTVFFNGLATGAQPILSQNHGGRRYDRVHGTLVRLIAVSTIMAAGLVTVAWIGSARLAAGFVPDHPEAIGLASHAMRTVSWSMLFAPVGIIGTMFFTSLENPVVSLLIAAARALFLPLLALGVLPSMLGAESIWFVPVVSEVVAALVSGALLSRWYSRRKGDFNLCAVVGVDLYRSADLVCEQSNQC